MGHDDYHKPLTDFLAVSNQESERGKVLVALAQIDTMLEEVLKSFLVKDAVTEKLFDSPNAPFATLYNKLNMAKALGLVSTAEWTAINDLRKIRNEFAHSVQITLNDQKVAALVAKLTFGLSLLIEKNDDLLKDSPARFSLCATSVITSLYNRAHYVAERRQSDSTWPA